MERALQTVGLSFTALSKWGLIAVECGTMIPSWYRLGTAIKATPFQDIKGLVRFERSGVLCKNPPFEDGPSVGCNALTCPMGVNSGVTKSRLVCAIH